MSEYIQSAFQAICKDAKPAKGAYVSLMVDVPYYGGPEEGGWWGEDTSVVAYQWCETEEKATAVKDAVEKLAKELSEESKKSSDLACLRQCEWLDERGLDSDFLPEPDGKSVTTLPYLTPSQKVNKVVGITNNFTGESLTPSPL